MLNTMILLIPRYQCTIHPQLPRSHVVVIQNLSISTWAAIETLTDETSLIFIASKFVFVRTTRSILYVMSTMVTTSKRTITLSDLRARGVSEQSHRDTPVSQRRIIYHTCIILGTNVTFKFLIKGDMSFSNER